METSDNTRLSVTKLIEKEELNNLTPEIDTDNVFITNADLSKPALQMAGFFDYFNSDRIQIFGKSETEFIKTLEPALARERYDQLTSYKMPCVIYSYSADPDMGMISACHRHQVPLLVSHKTTKSLVAELTRWLGVQLAPTQIVHGVLVDVYGEGVLITGDSGIGKSEVALELIRRGHRLVADDAVEIKKVSEVTLFGQAPELTKHLLELRGIGVLDVREMFGVECVKDTANIDIVINLEEWDGRQEYDHMGLEEHFTSFMDNQVPLYNVPLRPGRNVAIIVESAAVNSRAKKMGFNAAKELNKKLAEQGFHNTSKGDDGIRQVVDYAAQIIPGGRVDD